METVLANYEGKKNEGVDVTFWDRDELLRHEPHVSDKVIAASFNGDAKLNPMRPCFGSRSWPAKRCESLQPHRRHRITVRNGAVQSVKPAAAASPPRSGAPPASGPRPRRHGGRESPDPPGSRSSSPSASTGLWARTTRNSAIWRPRAARSAPA
ncbi:MAG: hypothetical protein ACLRWP_14060 [Bilophila wadsworthia]